MSVFPRKFDSFKGEQFVWDKFNEFLPDNFISYHNYAVGLKEADVVLLCPDKGVLIIEIKGFLAKNIINVLDNQFIVRINNPPDPSPLKQAKGYKFLLEKELSLLNVEDVCITYSVAYPFISRNEFFNKNLNQISNEKITFFKEDFDNFENFISKVNQIFDLSYDQFNSPNLIKNYFSSLSFHKIRTYFEGENFSETSEQTEVEFPHKSQENLFSRLIYINDKNDRTVEYYRSIVDDIFAGVEVYFYTKDIKLLESIKKGIVGKLKERNLLDNEEFYKEGKLTNNHFYSIEMCSLDVSSFEFQNGEFSNITILDKLDSLTNFNKNQYLIEHAPGNDIIVSAGAGTGKTYSLISRINYLIWKHHYPASELAKKIVMITFTNDAAESMKKKIQDFFLSKYKITSDIRCFEYYEAVEDMKISTIHSLTKAIIQKYSISLGLGIDYKIVTGTYEKERIIKNLVNDYINKNKLNIQLKLPNYLLQKRILSLISKLDNKNIDINLDKAKFGNKSSDNVLNSLFMNIVIDYQEQVKTYQVENNCIFLSELIKTLKRLTYSNDIMNRFPATKIDYLIVDEFQDTDDVQIEIMAKLSEVFGYKFFVVGDIKQCIYRFRGAEVKAFDTLISILSKKHRNLVPYSLNKNYRTDSSVLNKFNDIFKVWSRKSLLTYENNDVLTSNKFFENPGVYEIQGDSSKELIKLLKKIIKDNKKEETAILVRYNYQIDQIKKLCNENQIKVETDVGGDLYKIDPTVDFYKLVQAIKFNDSSEYLYNLYTTSYVSHPLPKKLLLSKSKNGDDLVEYFKLNPPINNWGKYTFEIRQNPVLKVLRDLVNEVKPWDNASNKDFIPEDEKEHIRNSYMKNVDELFEHLLDKSNSDYLTLNNISNYLEVMILTKQEELARAPYHRKTEGNNIICTTVHKAKGLEYDNVILPYCDTFDVSLKKAKGDVDVIVSGDEIGISVKLSDKAFGPVFVNQFRKKFEEEEYKDRFEEETRILYVALTRTKKRLYFLYESLKKKNTWAYLIKGV